MARGELSAVKYQYIIHIHAIKAEKAALDIFAI